MGKGGVNTPQGGMNNQRNINNIDNTNNSPTVMRFKFGLGVHMSKEYR